jgi:hypothetical protein
MKQTITIPDGWQDINIETFQELANAKGDILLPSYFRLSMTHLTSIKLFIESLGDEWLLNLEKWQTLKQY